LSMRSSKLVWLILIISLILSKLCSTEDILNLPLHPNPPGIETGELVVNLLKHQVRLSVTLYVDFFEMLNAVMELQSQALQWCIEHEYPELPKKETDRPVQFWQLRKNGNKVQPLALCYFHSLIK
jgi:SWI/SNF-related matrix-associated actin-dependent regulator of chromatin subfamily A3